MDDRFVLSDFRHRIKMGLSALSFWVAIVLPVVNLSALVVDYEHIDTGILFLGLVVLNMLALVGGRAYRNSLEHH